MVWRANYHTQQNKRWFVVKLDCSKKSACFLKVKNCDSASNEMIFQDQYTDYYQLSTYWNKSKLYIFKCFSAFFVIKIKMSHHVWTWSLQEWEHIFFSMMIICIILKYHADDDFCTFSYLFYRHLCYRFHTCSF